MRLFSLFARCPLALLVAVAVILLVAGDASAFGRRKRCCSAGASRPAASCSTGTCATAALPVGLTSSPAASTCPGGVCRPAGGYILR